MLNLRPTRIAEVVRPWRQRSWVVLAALPFIALSAYALAASPIWGSGGGSLSNDPDVSSINHQHVGPVAALDSAEGIGRPPSTDMVRGRGFDQATAALQPAIDLMPFDVAVPSYVPTGLRLNMLAAYEDSGKGFMQVFYDGEPADGVYREGEYQQEVSIIWEPFDPADNEPLQQTGERGEFVVDGRTWRYYVVNWPYYDTVEARTVVDGEIEIVSWIRVIGMDQDTAFSELQKIIGSM